MPPKPYQTLGSRVVRRTRWYTLREDQIKLPNGSQGIYGVIERPGAVWIVPALDDGRIALIRNYRYTIDRWLWEVPAGNLEPGLSPEENARRELAEEIGGTADGFEWIASMYTLPGMSDEQGHIFLARGVRPGQPDREPTEIMECHLFPAEAVMAMVLRGEVADGPSALALLHCAVRLGVSDLTRLRNMPFPDASGR